MRFERSSIPEIGRLLAVFAAALADGRFAEIGSGTGVGAAWIASAMGPEARLVTVELDDDRAAAVSRLFSEQPNVRVLQGDWHEVLPPEAPFDLLFFDGGGWKRAWEGDDTRGESDRALELVAPGGVVVIDDLTPKGLMPDEWAKADLVRDYWLGSDALLATEVLTTPETAAILAVKRR